MTAPAGYGRKFGTRRNQMALISRAAERVYSTRRRLTIQTFLLLVFLVLCGIYIVSKYLYDTMVPSSRVDLKVILAWTPFFDNATYLPRNLVGLGCEIDSCLISHNHDQLNHSDAIVFHWRDLSTDLPTTRAPKHHWVLLNYESPINVPWHTLQPIISRFNITVSYRLDSDIVSPYGRLRRRRQPQIQEVDFSENVQTFMSKKLVSWMVSHCTTSSKREKLVEMLKRYIPVDVYGDCGHLKAPCSKNASRIFCYSKLAQEYKFYLSFENSLCVDYVTEKLFLPMSVGLIPVVFGGANYSQLLPPNSFINALEFDTPKDLAMHLIAVASNFTLYQKYFAWRDSYEIVHNEVDFYWLCDLCRLLHDKPVRRHVTTTYGFFEWWFIKGACHPWTGYTREQTTEINYDNKIENEVQVQNIQTRVNRVLDVFQYLPPSTKQN